ncbi:MAG TPA: hypothetical protein VLW50_33240 [Streptosporangiaceae bacterium]|nr:hypothetical protein [Streptosporangiaceae bacterium]
MSPVSRGRKAKPKTKAKKANKRAAGRPGTAQRGDVGLLADAGLSPFALQLLTEPRRRPQWFDVSIKAILDRAGDVMAAQGPRELEQATAELVGAELWVIVRDECYGMWFDWLFEELADGAAARVRQEAERHDGRWEAPWRLLHGLTSIGSPALRSTAQSALARAGKGLPAGAAAGQPGWLRQLPRIAATGEVWEMHDAYGSRFAVIAGFSYPGGTDPSVFLFDIDACGLVTLASAGVFDDVEQAATAWRALVGEAGGARPSPVETPDRLVCVVHLDDGEESLSGSESRAVMDNWFRARRRHHDLADALRKRGMPLPEAKSLYRDIDIEPMAEAFTGWYARRHGSKPDPDVVDAVAEEWLEGTLPGTWHAASPHRAQFQVDLISDWIPDNPVTVGAKTLLPEWVRWNGEQSGLPGHLTERAVAAASGGPRSPADGAADCF